MREGDYGLFVTLSNYTKNAQKYLENTSIIRGINGTELVELILKYEESVAYKEKVRSFDKNLVNASLKWFIGAGIITQENYDTYQNIRRRRNDITHELLKNLNVGFVKKMHSYINEIVFGDGGDKYKKLLNELIKSEISDFA